MMNGIEKIKHLLFMTKQVYQQRGLKVLLVRVKKYLKEDGLLIDTYKVWQEQNENFSKSEALSEIESFTYQPKISILTPVYNVDPKWLDKCFESVVGQWYQNWEFCLHDDASTNVDTINCLKKWEKKDARIKVSYGEKNGHISYATNQAIALATGEWFALLDNDDELSPNALYENVKALNKDKEIDLLYSDEDKLEMSGRRSDPYFKPDFSLDFFLSTNYLSHFIVGRKSILDEIGGYRLGYEGSQDYDLLLRIIEKARKIHHIPKILYHWRKIPGSTACKPDAKNYAYEAAQKSLRSYMERNSIEGEVFMIDPGFYRIKRTLPAMPKVSMIIPFRDQCDMLRRCVDSILKKTEYQNYEILLVDNQSSEPAMLEYLESVKKENNPKLKVIAYDHPFNYSAINNYAASQAEGEYILLLNNDTEVINEEWLSAMMEYALEKGVGAVGAKLYFPNDTIQHAGVMLGVSIAGHAFKGFPRKSPGYFSMLTVARGYSAVTGACLLTKKSIYHEIGGLNEDELGVAYNDVDYCLRLREKNYRVVFTPFAELYHYESLTRGYDDVTEAENPEKYRRVKREQEYMHTTWKKYIECDPMYNINLSRIHEDFSLRIALKKK